MPHIVGVHFYKTLRTDKSETESELVVARGWMRGNGECLLCGYEMSIQGMENSGIVMMVAQYCECA